MFIQNLKSQTRLVAFAFGCLAFFLGSLKTFAAPVMYLGLIDNATGVSRLSRYTIDTDNLTTLNAAFAPFSFLAWSPAGTLYAADGASLFSVNPDNGTATPVANLTCDYTSIECSGLTFRPDGTMYVHEYSNRTGAWAHRLYSGDSATGPLTYLADITGTNGLYGIEYATGVLYGGYDNALYSINPSTGAATLLGTGTSAWDLSFGADGVLRGSHPFAGAIDSIDPATGNSTRIKNFLTSDQKEPWGLAADVGFTVSGTITLQDYVGDITGVPVTVEVRNPGYSTPLESHVVHPSVDGGYLFTTNLIYGTYDVAAKASHWLRQRQGDVHAAEAGATVHFSLINGDCDGDNEVTTSDLASVLSAMDSGPGDPNWDPTADLDGDNEVTSSDLATVMYNMDLMGDE